MKKWILLPSILVLAGFADPAGAVPVSFNQTQNQTLEGELFNFIFNGVPLSDGTGGEFILHAQGDYDGRDDETLTWDIEGIVSGGPVGGFNDVVLPIDPPQGGPFDFVIVHQPLGNVEFQRTYLLTGAEVNAIVADGTISIFADLFDTVGFFNPPNFVEVTFNYSTGAAPEPSTLLLLGLGLMGVARARRRRG